MQISRFCGFSQRFSLQNLGHGILWHGASEQSVKFFSPKIIFSANSQKFSASKVSRDTVVKCCD